jgi:hypothetical protein
VIEPSSPAPAVSVVVPTYQRRVWVTRAVQSVLAQTFRDFELIVVDDGSTDGTGEALAGLDPRIRYLWQPNRGPGAARNAGIGLARAEIVAFLDSDNRWLPCHLEVVTEVLRLYPQAVLATTSAGEYVAGRGRPGDARLVDFLPLALADAIFGTLSSVAVRTRELHAVGGFGAQLPVMEDTDLWLRLAARGPFATLRRRTLVHQLTVGSRLRRGIELGTYVPTFEAVARRAVEAVSGAERPDRLALEAMARGRLHYAAVLRALVEGDDESVAAHLAEACSLLPELSRQPYAMARRIRRTVHGARERARVFATAAELWPDRSADTAVFLRIRAVTATLRAGRPVVALGRLRRLPPAHTARFLLAKGPLWRQLFRTAAYHWFHRGREQGLLSETETSLGGAAGPGREALDLDARGDVAEDDGSHRHE